MLVFRNGRIRADGAVVVPGWVLLGWPYIICCVDCLYSVNWFDGLDCIGFVEEIGSGD